jgi:hypothetical protein
MSIPRFLTTSTDNGWIESGGSVPAEQAVDRSVGRLASR